MSGPMVRAILDDRKTQTRRVMNPQPRVAPFLLSVAGKFSAMVGNPSTGGNYLCPCPYGKPGDRLYVRETWGYRGCSWSSKTPSIRSVYIEYIADQERRTFVRDSDDESGIPHQNMPERLQGASRYPANDAEFDLLLEHQEWLARWWTKNRPAIHMPKWAARLWLEVTAVRVERLQEISQADARAEGCKSADIVSGRECLNPSEGSYALHFRDLWDSLNAKRAPWESNPWVWVVSFRRCS